jgi:hypothetical protein
MVAAMVMFPLAALSRFNRKGFVQAVAMGAIGVAVMAAVVLSSPAMYERFFGLDASMSVGGVSITPVVARNVGAAYRRWGQRPLVRKRRWLVVDPDRPVLP